MVFINTPPGKQVPRNAFATPTYRFWPSRFSNTNNFVKRQAQIVQQSGSTSSLTNRGPSFQKQNSGKNFAQ